MSAAFAQQVLTWFECGAPWRLKLASFYEQYEFSLLDAALPADLQPLCDAETLSYLPREIGSPKHSHRQGRTRSCPRC
jgi:hypothetical protein